MRGRSVPLPAAARAALFRALRSVLQTGHLRGAALPATALFLALRLATGSEPGALHGRGAQAPGRPPCDADNGGITLPEGFCALAVADGLGPVRHLVVAPNGDIYAAVRDRRGGAEQGHALALRDTTGDGKADVIARFAPHGGTGIALQGRHLYFAPDDAVLRFTLEPGQLVPPGAPDTIVKGLPATRSHTAKTLALDEAGGLYVNIGSPSNSCQVRDRVAGAPGEDPCPALETRAGVWRFDANRMHQTQADGVRFATGLRNTVALAMNTQDRKLYGAVHGRDQLHQNWGQYFDADDGAEKPAEEFVLMEQGDDFGWPYCYYDPELAKKLLAPEYGGDGKKVERCSGKKAPLIAFPGHWGPNALLFYTGAQFPERYRGGGFIAFHGSWNRAPFPQGGYKVVFVPFAGGRAAGGWEVFADGFTGQKELINPSDARHRPTGLAQGPDGSLYITDDQRGRIWRVIHRGGR
ncbi:MAG: PQQ-dependent sugar dehydrogenase [Gemmatimonadetes bacterium]|nr:PQQ-dependent sugar dehydrogenase [Gemmatimonadota bacterium]